mmetsp:Transcript_25042/g.64654  ORF Transcript_25042/g.64654 Transcript_25042/m.64654 type:complete len:229 (+) Transcript_25042:1753-2439(+)
MPRREEDRMCECGLERTLLLLGTSHLVDKCAFGLERRSEGTASLLERHAAAEKLRNSLPPAILVDGNRIVLDGQAELEFGCRECTGPIGRHTVRGKSELDFTVWENSRRRRAGEEKLVRDRWPDPTPRRPAVHAHHLERRRETTCTLLDPRRGLVIAVAGDKARVLDAIRFHVIALDLAIDVGEGHDLSMRLKMGNGAEEGWVGGPARTSQVPHERTRQTNLKSQIHS